ncbi:hypothetical protein [Halosimplex sp. TS25]|uniref:hypothetical protein n=1 Tax=Halosimplex rarum TaxID=3396619 RepID=UPI0039E8A798
MSTQEPEDDRAEPVATRIELSFPADIGKHGRKRISSEYYKTYLKKVHDSAAVGDEWDEFTDVGCCGSQMDVPLVVEGVEGGARIDSDTEIEYTEREACGVNPGWSVQHDEPEALDD